MPVGILGVTAVVRAVVRRRKLSIYWSVFALILSYSHKHLEERRRGRLHIKLKIKFCVVAGFRSSADWTHSPYYLFKATPHPKWVLGAC